MTTTWPTSCSAATSRRTWRRCWTGSCPPWASRSPISANWSPTGAAPGACCSRHAAATCQTQNPGFPSASELVARYEQVTGRHADTLAWFEVFATVKLAIIVAGAQARLRDQDPERADHSWGLVRHLAEIAAALPG